MIQILFYVALGVLLIVLWAVFVEPNWYRLRRLRISIPNKVRKPFTVLHLSDTHFQKNSGAKKRFFQQLSMLNPDLLFLTGDIIDNDEGIDTAIRLLSGIRARYGAYMVLGNHDYYDYQIKDVFLYNMGFTKMAAKRNNVARFLSELKRIGINVLINQSVRLDVHGNSVLIAGTDDPVTQHVDFERTLHDLKPNSVNILLTHFLDCLLKLSHHGIDLALAGHTHGGQLRIPFLGPIVYDLKLPYRFIQGLHEYKGIKTFVSRGLGASRLTFPRLACRPEAIFFEILP